MIFKPTEVGWRLGRADECAGLPDQVWDPVAGCADSIVAERRADGGAVEMFVLQRAEGPLDHEQG
jgi:hypothetical protein